ncbi:MAG TPA: sigma-70 family RNA polymerase sigma factor [Bacteroidota bacterium]|nr:sigma-70 family RNA polymerase sigma factor [Bacteroidota bacterium]
MNAPLLFLNNDAKILDLIRNRGDEEGLAILFDENRRAVTSFVLKNSGSREDAEELLQDAVVILWEKVRREEYEYRAKLSTFILATVKNLWFRRLAQRRREHRDQEFVEAAPNDEPSPLEELIEGEDAKIVGDALRRLGEPCRTLLLLFYWEELSLEQIGMKMGFANADTVKSKKYQCKKGLEGLLHNML